MSHKDILAASAGNIVNIIRRAISEEKEQLSELKDLHVQNKERMSEIAKTLESLDRSINGFVLNFLPVVGSRRLARLHGERNALLSERKRINSEMGILQRGAKDCIDCVRELERLGTQVKSWTKQTSNLHNCSNYIDQVVILGNKSSFYRKSLQSERAGVALDLGKRYVTLVSQLSKINNRAQDRPLPKPALVDELSSSELRRAQRFRVYLPIHHGQKNLARELGAKTDDRKRRGGKEASNLYVTLDQNLTPFENLLPLAFRSNPPKLTFPPISPGSAGHNVRKIFAPATWDHIRKINYEHTGKRCLICGNQRGIFQDQIAPEVGKNSTVECHEVWDWEHDGSAVGIQRLKNLITLCVDCHMMFHVGHAVNKAGAFDREADAQILVEARRQFATRLEEEVLQQQIDAENADWQERTRVDSWVIDLSHLADQSYMQSITPRISEDLKQEISQDMIAGISFIGEEGEFHEAREAEEIYHEMVEKVVAATRSPNFQ